MNDVNLIRVAKGVKIVSPWPAIYLENHDMLVVSDLHLGLEDELENKGVHIPTSMLPKIMMSVLEPIRRLGCSRLVIDGDVKHEFGSNKEAEWWAVKKIFKAVRALNCETEVVRGNHDNYIISILKELDVPLHEPNLQVGGFLLKHGHEPLLNTETSATHVIIGHEHPALSIKDDLGAKHRFKVFLTGRMGSQRITVLPSVSPLAYGSDVNDVRREDMISPLLRSVNIGNFTPYLIDTGLSVRRFPRLSSIYPEIKIEVVGTQ